MNQYILYASITLISRETVIGSTRKNNKKGEYLHKNTKDFQIFSQHLASIKAHKFRRSNNQEKHFICLVNEQFTLWCD